jgi:hypothetical protein
MKSKNKLQNTQKKMLARLANVGPFIEGSLTTVKRICGTPSCRCMNGGEKHEAMFFTWKEKAKSRSLYVPVEYRKEALLWNKNYKKVKKLIRLISDIQKKIVKS